MKYFFIPESQISFIDYPNKIADMIYVKACNFNCEYCYNKKTLNDISEKLFLSKEDTITKLMTRELTNASVFTGGEVSQVPPEEMIYVFNRIKERKKIKVDSNGSNFGWIKQVSDFVDLFAIDIKGGESLYKKISSQKDAFENLKETIKFLNKINKQVIYRFVYYPPYSVIDNEFEKILNYLKNNYNKDFTDFSFEKYNRFGLDYLPEVEIKEKDFEEWKSKIKNNL